MSDKKTFPCTRCGECCRHIGASPLLSEYDRGDGVCVHLRGNLCDIYSNRPDVCNVDLMYNKYFHKIFTKQEYYKENLRVCQKLREKE